MEPIFGLGGAGADPPTSKMGTIFLMTLALSKTISNQKYHQIKTEEHLKPIFKMCEHAPSTTVASYYSVFY